MTGRVLGPLTVLDAGSEQQAIMLGPDQDNFVKLAVINRGGVPGIEFYAEQAAPASPSAPRGPAARRRPSPRSTWP